MRIDQIEVGKTYEGRTGKPRTVTKKYEHRGVAAVDDITVDGQVAGRCSEKDLLIWAKSDAPTSTIAVLREALRDVFEVMDYESGAEAAAIMKEIARTALAATDPEVKP